jgi:hypothetical protein
LPSIRISPLLKGGLAEQLKTADGGICAVDFGTNREPIDDMESMRVPHDCRHDLSALDISLSFCCHLIFGHSPHSTRSGEKEKPGLIARHQMSPTVFSRRFEIENH